MRRGLLLLLVFILLLVAPTAVRYVQHYQLSGSDRTMPPSYDVAAVVESVPTPASATFIDTPEMFGGAVLLDQAHDNAFTLDEIGYLDGRLAARGVEMVTYTGDDLAIALRAVNAFVVITPLKAFTAEEIRAVTTFVQRGGNLLMLGDPTRYNVVVEEDLFSFNVFIETDKIPLNSLANEFDIIFNGDYLYNTIENEGNFRNIIVTDEGLMSSPLTADLERLALYGAHSLQVGAGAEALIAGDDNTWSSATDRPGGLTLAATAANGRVLAVGDIQFVMEPYFTVYDNGRFIARIADFLAQPIERDYTVADFPYFFGETVSLVYTGSPDLGPNAFDEIITLQSSLRAAGKEVSLTTADSQSGDTIYLGLYNQASDIADLLANAGINLTIEPAILTAAETAALAASEDKASEDTDATDTEADAPSGDEVPAEEEPVLDRLIQSDVGNVHMSGTALILLDESGGQRRLVVLAASNKGLENTVIRLLDLIPLDGSYALADCLLQDNLALCPTNITAEEVEAELLTGGLPETEEADGGMTGNEEAGSAEDPAAGSDEPIVEEINALDQGNIGLGETIEGTLLPDESFSWTFQDGPAFIDIIVASGEDLDAVLELYDADNVFLAGADSGFAGDDETLVGVEIPDDGAYTIVLRDFFDNGGDFALTVSESSETPPDDSGEGDTGDAGSGGDVSIFLFIDDDGDPIGSGFSSQEALETLLEDNYTVETWVSTVDGALTLDALETADLLIWDSGDYQNPDGFFDEDSTIIFEFLDSGGAALITGSSPTIFGDIGLAALSDVEFYGEDELLLAGFAAGDTVALDDTYDVMFSDFLVEDLEPDATAFLLRGASSEESGHIVGLASIDELNNDQKTVMLLLPFSALPADVQEPLLTNLLTWLGFAIP